MSFSAAILRRRISLMLWAAALSLAAAAGGCREAPAPGGVALVPAGPRWRGVRFQEFESGGSRVSLVDVDLRTPGIELVIVPRHPQLKDGSLYGVAHTLPEWLGRAGALAGVNGGFFGEQTAAGEKQILGLFVQNGRALAAAPPARSRSGAVSFARSCFGLEPSGEPWIGWGSAPRRGASPTRHAAPEVEGGAAAPWPVRSAMACGPRLIEGGKRRVTDHEERLVSPGARPRTLVGFARDETGEPRTLVLAAAGALDFAGSAHALDAYFRREHGVPCAEAMAFDGGASTQLAYRDGGRIVAAVPSAVTVPSAVLVRAAPQAATTR